MTLFEQIRSKHLELRKAHSTIAATIISTLIGEIENKTKGSIAGLTEKVVIEVIQKFIKNVDDTIKANIARGNNVDALLGERDLYMQFLPQQLTLAELHSAIDMSIVTSGAKNIGEVMNYLKTNYSGRFDAKTASNLLKGKFQ